MSDEARRQCGQKLQAARELRGLTRNAFGKLVHVSQVTVYRWENGLRMPSFEDRMLVAETLGCDPWAIEVDPLEPAKKAS